MIIPVIVLILIVALFALLWHFSNTIIFPMNYTPQESLDEALEAGHFSREDYEALPKQELTIQSPFGYDLFGMYIPNEEHPESRHTVIIVHGIRVNMNWSLKYLWVFRNRGFHVLMIEHRNHGRSGGTTTSYGYYEKYDLKAWVNWVEANSNSECSIGTHGESMGAATVLQHAAVDKRIRFVIADCPFDSAMDEFAYRMKAEFHLPRNPLLPMASRLTKWRTGFAFEDASPIKAVKNIDVPVLFIHGDADDYIPPSHSQKLYDAKVGAKQIWFAPDSIHAKSFPDHPEAYDEQVGLFLETYGLLPVLMGDS